MPEESAAQPRTAPLGLAGAPGTRRDTVRRRAEILEAAKQVFSERGLDGARTRDIAAAAGVTPTVMYRYFATKEELFTAAVIDPLEDLLEQLYVRQREDLGSAPDVKARRKILLHQSRTWLETMDEIAPLLGAALFSNTRQGAVFYADRVYPAIQRVVEGLPSMIRGWGGDDVDISTLAFTIFGAYFTVAMDRHFRGGGANLEELVSALADQIVFGVMPRPAVADDQG